MASPLPAAPDMSRGGTRHGGVEDRYRSLFVIGRGGMGTVEVALEQAAPGCERVVALKRLLPEGARDPRHKEMFLREARLAALLAHPNVVHAFAFGELYGQLFMSMEYVEGEPLSHVLRASQRSGPGLGPPLVAFVLAQVCDGLHAAHELRDDGGLGQPLNVVHRDVSPHNVMIAYEGDVKLLDFGVAKFETGGNETRTGEVKGKMAYMSPEQALGERLDRRSDLFSIGAVLFECLTGSRMWGPGTDLDVMRKLALERPPPLDLAMPGAPPALVDLHARLVAHDPGKRPASAREVAEELRAFAAASVPAANSEALRAWMLRLFGPESERRRALLVESLDRAAFSGGDGLRLRSESRAAFAPTSTELLAVEARPQAKARVPGSQKSVAFIGAALVVLAGAMAMASSAMLESPAPDQAVGGASATIEPTRASTPAAALVPRPTRTVTPVSTATATAATATATATATMAAVTATAPTSAAPAVSAFNLRSRPWPVLPAPPPTPPTPIKLPDVDPTPF